MFRLVAAIFLPVLAIAADIEEEAGVLVMTKANFDEGIKTHKNILVEFYVPWCSHCQTLAPEYITAAASLANLEFPSKLAKVDASSEEDLASKYGVQSYPTLKFFKNSVPSDYTGGRTSAEIVKWLAKALSTDDFTPPVHILTTKESVDLFTAAHDRTLVAYCTDKTSQLVRMFDEVAATVKDHTFGLVHDSKVINTTRFGDNKIVIYKQKPKGMYDFTQNEYMGNQDPEQLRKFITSESFPAILELKPDTAHYIFDPEVKTHVLLFLSKEGGEFETSGEPLIDLATEVRQRTGAILDKSVLFVAIDVDAADHEHLKKTFGVKAGLRNTPAIRIAKLTENGDLVKYQPREDIGHYLDPETVKQFVYDYLDGKLEGYLLSQTLPLDWDAKPVKVLVASNFDDITLDKTKDVLVQFYAPWCDYCHRFASIYEKVAQVFVGRFDGAEDIVIAEIDATANELGHTKITHYPTIKLYKRGTNKVVDFTGERSLEALVKFVETGGKFNKKIGETPNTKDEL